MTVGKKVAVTAVAALALAGTASAQSGGWTKISTARDSSDYLAMASLMKTGIKHTNGLMLRVRATSTAKVSGSVSCSKGWDYDSYDFSFRMRNGTHSLRVPHRGSECSLDAMAELPDGGTVTIDAFRR